MKVFGELNFDQISVAGRLLETIASECVVNIDICELLKEINTV